MSRSAEYTKSAAADLSKLTSDLQKLVKSRIDKNVAESKPGFGELLYPALDVRFQTFRQANDQTLYYVEFTFTGDSQHATKIPILRIKVSVVVEDETAADLD